MHYMIKEIREQEKSLRITYDKTKNNVSKIADVINIKEIKNIFIAARGTSDHAAVYAKYVIEVLTGIPTGLSASSVNTVYNSKLNYKNSLVIAISQSGMGEDILEVIKKANADGAMTLGITNNEDSKIAKEAKYHINIQAGVEKSVAATKTFTSQMLIVRMLAGFLSNSKTNIDNIANAVKYAIKKEKEIEAVAEKLYKSDEMFILGRGVNYPTALESALKLAETSYIGAKGYATSDFRHGPFALLDKSIPVILLAPDDSTKGEMIILQKELNEKNIKVLSVTNVIEIKENSTFSLENYKMECELDYPFSQIPYLQMLSYYISLKKGLDPDNPRDLKKVTITK